MQGAGKDFYGGDGRFGHTMGRNGTMEGAFRVEGTHPCSFASPLGA